MKTYFFSLLVVVCSVSARGQELELDSATNKLMYRGVVRVDSAKAGDLYELGLQWVARSYRSANDVVQYQNKEEGKIMAKGNWTSLETAGEVYEHLLVLEFRDGRARYTFTDFVRNITTGVLAGRTPLESIKFLKKNIRSNFAAMAAKTARSFENGLTEKPKKKDDGW